jgi:hypothetical protein
MVVASTRNVRFTVEQIFLTDGRGRRAEVPPKYHLVEGASVDEVLAGFLNECSATLVGTVEKYRGAYATATARTDEAVFTLHVLPGSDTFHLVR